MSMERPPMAAGFPSVAPEPRLSAPPPGAGPKGAPSDLRTLRAALALLVEDPPFALGGSTLARHMLPQELDVLQRGWALADMLQLAITYLRPPHTIPPNHRRWWPYQICIGEFIEGRSRGEVQALLAISASTYTRAKHRGLECITATLPYIAAESQHPCMSSAQARDAP